MRFAIVNLVPTPYREPLYEGLSRTPGLTTRVFYLQASDSLRGWSELECRYDALRVRCLTPESLYPLPVFGVLSRGLLSEIARFSPDCLLVYGYSYFPQMQVIRWAIRWRKPYFVWADSNSLQLDQPGIIAACKSAWLRYLCRHAAGAITIGTLNEEFWKHYGMPAERLFRSPLAVDNEHFASGAEVWKGRRAATREALGLPSNRLLLYAGRFARNKNLDVVIRALARRHSAGDRSVSLVLVGGGPEKSRLDRLIRALGLGGGLTGVFQFDFQPQSELPKFYGIADALVLPSTDEPWGLVVNEAMASGLPVLLSRSTGCRPDLLEEGRNGFSFDETDVESVAACLEQFSSIDDLHLAQMGSRSSQLIAGWNYSNAMAGIFRALDTVDARAGRPLRVSAAVSAS